jgi:hypothetical protein
MGLSIYRFTTKDENRITIPAKAGIQLPVGRNPLTLILSPKGARRREGLGSVKHGMIFSE